MKGSRPLREDLVTQAFLEVYGQVRHEGRLADRALESTLRKRRQLFAAERRQVSEQVYGLLRAQRRVDFALERAMPDVGRRPSTQQDLLRLAALRVLEGESPKQVTKALALGADDGAALGKLKEALGGVAKLEREARFGIEASVPDPLAKRLLAEFGEDAWALARAFNERAPLYARVNSLKIDRAALLDRLREEDVDAKATPLSPLGIELRTRLNAFALPSFKDGLFELQDEGSQLLGMLVDAPPTRVVDACAGAGGKTLQLAAQMKNRGDLHAFDIDEGRLEELRRRARRAGVHNVRVKVLPSEPGAADQAIAELVGKADRVLVDAPCSGTGTLRRKPDVRYRLKVEEIAPFAARQKELLHRFSALVKPGGRLIYGTCSILREENEDVVAAFLGEHLDFERYDAAKLLPAEIANQVTTDGALRLFPHRHRTDGFFGAVLARRR